MKIIIKETSQHPLFTDLFLSPWHWAFAIHAKHFFVCQASEIIFYGMKRLKELKSFSPENIKEM